MYCDESIKKGKYYSNFYGGAVVYENDMNYIIDKLNEEKRKINLLGELKWTNVSANQLNSYIDFIDKYFDLIKEGYIKIRIMFKQEYNKTVGLTEEQEDNEFYILYYQFFKNAFGFEYCNEDGEPIELKIFFDKLPNKKIENERFKNYIQNLETTEKFKRAQISISPQDITDVDSKRHVILQGMDIILGSIKFRLNEEHKIIPEGKRRRGKKTIAKEKLYKHINRRIRDIYPNFNVGISTGIKGDMANKWKNEYRHWNFISTNHQIDQTKKK